MQTDWQLIVSNILEAVNKVKIIKVEESSNEEEGNLEETFDLQKILDLNQLNIKQASEIENNHLNAIRAQLEKEVHFKLALQLTPMFSGAITWVACVICWYKLQNNVLTKFEEKKRAFEN